MDGRYWQEALESYGEGITYAMNAQAVLVMAYPYLTKGDKQGWLKLGMEYQK
jgi:hypothetical protein